MNKLNTTLAFAAGIAVLGGVSAQAQTVIYDDNFTTANGNLDSASLSRLSGVDGQVGSGFPSPQSGGSQQLISGNQLSLTLGGGATTSEMRFGIQGVTATGASPTLFDWSSGAGGSAITSAGGMNISFNWTAPNTTSDNWIFFAAGTEGDVSYSNLRVVNSSTTAGILFKDNGQSQTFNAGTLVGSGSYTPTSVNHVVDLTYDFTSWANGSPVTMTATVDGNVVGTDSFTWRNSSTGEFLDVGTYSDPTTLGNFEITTVPEPSSWVMLAGGLGTLVAVRRFRRS